ncbi:MAG: ISNCY family transposase [Candidatus Margulisbacteria bacterium]|nr:ISNCY family transposase [Candidatus Margulisiibacteriota bacterium]
MRKDIIIMSKKEIKRLPIIHKVMDKRLTQVGAAEMLDLSDRQIRRIIDKIRVGGNAAIVHGNRGKESPFKYSEELEDQIMGIVEKKYYDFGPTFAAEKLLECEKIKLSKEKLRQLMISYDTQYPKRRKKDRVHQWRERKHCRGEMIQMDGSDHDWLEGRGPKMVLMGYIDDASSEVFGRFYEYEGTIPAMDSFKRYMAKYGIPFSFYVDRHSAYKTSRQPNLEEDLKGAFAKTQFARALDELNVKIIYAQTPQAKGRIERAFETLQDRLTKELRLAGISTLEQANVFLVTYLTKYNARFAVKPFKKTNLHQPVRKLLKLNEIFCIKEFRTISNGFIFQWKNRKFLIKNPSITMKKQRVCIMEHFDGTITLKLKDKYLSFIEVTQKDLKAIEADQKAARKLIKKARVYYRPSKNHPWKSFRISKKSLVNA